MAQKLIEELCLNNTTNPFDWHKETLTIFFINIIYFIKKNLYEISFSSPHYLCFLSILLFDFFYVFAFNR